MAAALGSSLCPGAEGIPRAGIGTVYLKVNQRPLMGRGMTQKCRFPGSSSNQQIRFLWNRSRGFGGCIFYSVPRSFLAHCSLRTSISELVHPWFSIWRDFTHPPFQRTFGNWLLLIVMALRMPLATSGPRPECSSTSHDVQPGTLCGEWSDPKCQ